MNFEGLIRNGEFDPIYSHVTYTYWDHEQNETRTLIGSVKDYELECTGRVALRVKHFCGDDWPIVPFANEVEFLEREYETLIDED